MGTLPVEKGLAKGFLKSVVGQTHLKANDYLKPAVGTNSLQISTLLQSYFLIEATQLPGVISKCGCNNHSAIICPSSKEYKNSYMLGHLPFIFFPFLLNY